tara:strand:- start:459 stop:662 length:204 start_codon:yes stop_codon:yes gene_type:complete
MDFFKKLGSYENYLQQNPFHKLLNIDLKEYGDVKKKIKQQVYYAVDPNLKEAIAAELDDLVRLLPEK